MKIIAINTATESCSVALWNNGLVCSLFKENSLCEHTKYILPMVKNILNKNKISLKELDALAFSRGPGSFNGIRIGIGIAQGLALGANLPMIGISTLATIAQCAWRNFKYSNVLVAINARMGEIYWAEYFLNKEGVWCGEESESLLKLESVKEKLTHFSDNWILVGTGWKTELKISNKYDYINIKKINTLLPLAEDMLPIAYRLMMDNKTVSVEKSSLVYLRDKVTYK